MNYIEHYTNEGKIDNHFIVVKDNSPTFDSFKKIIFEAINKHPLTKGKFNFEETYKIVSKIKKKDIDWYDIEAGEVVFNVFWG